MKKILNKSKLIGSLVALVAAGTVAAAMSEHVGNVGANDEAYSQYADPTEAFISQIGESARQLGQENDLYASVMIAQAILESGSGQSGLSSILKKFNNCVFPGFPDVRAKFLRFSMVLIKEDLPTFDRPASATSGISS